MNKADQIEKEALLYRISQAAKDLPIDELKKFADGMSSLAYVHRLVNGEKENETDDTDEQLEAVMKIVREKHAEWAILGLASCYLKSLSDELIGKK